MRIRSVHLLFTVLFILLVSCLYYLQIIKGEMYREMSYRNSIRLLSMDAPRGIIYDRHNRKLASNELSFGVFIVPQEVDDLDAEIGELAKILEVPESLLRRNYKRNYYAPFAPCELARNVSKQKALIIEEVRLNIPGVLVKEIALRRYQYERSCAHAVGYIGEIDRGELDLLKSYGYSAKDLIGKDGIERVADSFLRGKDGGMQIQVDNRGRQVKVLGSKSTRKGNDIYLTLDGDLQKFLWKMMKGRKGAAVFMDPYNGEILSLVSVPSYNPNDSLAEALNDIDAPLFNRAIMGQYPAGSLFKLVVALAGMESGKLEYGTKYTCNGSLSIGNDEFRCWKGDGHGPMSFEDAIIESCNVYFYNAGLLVGVEKISEYARQFGFGRKTGIELFGEAEGFVPSKVWKKLDKNERWWTGDTANLSIGQGYMLVSPLQVARMISGIANGGELVEPHIVRRMEGHEMRHHKNIKLKIKKENIEFIRRAMKRVVEDTDGTGNRALSEIVSISAKTGTSQAGEGLRPHAWFGGFAPSDNPGIAFVVFLEHGGSGGDIAALIAKKAVEYWYRHR